MIRTHVFACALPKEEADARAGKRSRVDTPDLAWWARSSIRSFGRARATRSLQFVDCDECHGDRAGHI